MINEARCTCEIKSRIAMAQAAFNRQKTFHQQTGLKFKEETSEMLHLDHNIVCAKTWAYRKVDQKHLVLEKDGEDQVDRSCEK